MTISLPDQPPVPLKVEFLYDVGVGFLSGQGQDMIIMPMVPDLVDDWAKTLPRADKEKYKDAGSGCGWTALRSFIGTTDYMMNGVFNGRPQGNIAGSGLDVIICQENPIYDVFEIDFVEAVAKGILGVTEQLKTFQLRTCARGGDMSMTIVARFESPTSGFGHVYFQGNTDRSRFSGNAPIKLSR